MGASRLTVRRVWVALYLTWITVGLVLLLTTGLPHWLLWSGGVYLLFAAGIATLGFQDVAGRRRAALTVLAIGLIGYMLESAGVHTGFPFGRYTYGPDLGPRLAGVPVAIAGAWVCVIAIGWGLTPHRWPRLVRSVVAGVLTTSLDFLVDPVASGPLHDWTWHTVGGYFGVPWGNFFAWFVLATATHLLLTLLPRSIRPPRLIWLLFFSLSGLFTVIGLAHELVLPAVVGVVPCICVGLVAERRGPRLLHAIPGGRP